MQSIAPAESEGRKANLVTDVQSWQQLKKQKLEMLRPAHCSLYLLCSQERERKKLIALFFFSFSLQHGYPPYYILSASVEGPQVKTLL